jgi:parallel beta-helix repeat protein
VNQTYTRIQDALDAAPSGATITVVPGIYGERLVVTKPVKLQGNQAVLNGLAGGLDGRFVGIEVQSNDVEISGFVIQNYERGIVADSVANFRLYDNEVRTNTSKDPPPISAGVTKSDGVVLYSVQNSEIADNFIHDNGSIGLLAGQRLGVSISSNDNTVRRNRFVNNGTQQGLPGSGHFGASILIAAPSARNQVLDNEMSGSYWGIIIFGPSNTVRSNRITGNSRAGIMVYGAHNVIENNAATGNGSANFYPNCRYDLMDYRDIDNTWRDNAGTFGSGEPPYVNPFVSLFCN